MRSKQSGLQSGTGQLDTSGIDLSNIGTGGVGTNVDSSGFGLDDSPTTEGADPSDPSSTDMGYGFKQGGLAKRKPKPKKMKRGGLASK